MNQIFDDLSRVLGAPLPRREVFKNVGRVLAGAGVASLGLPRLAWADTVDCCEDQPNVDVCRGLQRKFCDGPPGVKPTCCAIGFGGQRGMGLTAQGCCPAAGSGIPANHTQCCRNVTGARGEFVRTRGNKGCCPPDDRCCDFDPTALITDRVPCCPNKGVCCRVGTGPVAGCCPTGSRCCNSDDDIADCCPAVGLPATHTACCAAGSLQACCPPAESKCCKNGATPCCPTGGTCCHDTGLAMPKAPCCPPATPKCCPVEAKGNCCPKDHQCCTPGQSSIAECCPPNTDCCDDGAHKGCCPREGAWNFEGGGTFVVTSIPARKSAIRAALLGTASAHDADSFVDTGDIFGSLSAFNYATRTQIESLSFSFVQGELLSGGDLMIVGDGIASVNGVPASIQFSATESGDVVTFEITAAQTGTFLAGGLGEIGRAELSLTLEP